MRNKIFIFILLLLFMDYPTYIYCINHINMAKKRKVGRPAGLEKEPMNIFIKKDRAAKLRDLAKTEQKTISIMVENALEAQYGL